MTTIMIARLVALTALLTTLSGCIVKFDHQFGLDVQVDNVFAED